MALLEAINVGKAYRSHTLAGTGAVKPVLDNVSLSIGEGETLALLGRSGCGKSTLARLIAGLEKPDSGHVLWNGQPVTLLHGQQARDFRRDVQMVFQDSPGAVNSRFTIGEIIAEPLEYLTAYDAEARQARVQQLLDMVGLPAGIATMLPAQTSGGQLQRVCIARALAPQPKLVILDEAVSNLDIHLQAASLALLRQLQIQEGIACLFITHDFRLVERFASSVAIMDQGRIVEECQAGQLHQLQHPTSQELRDAVLPPLPSLRDRIRQQVP